jgi:hypothetical protein
LVNESPEATNSASQNIFLAGDITKTVARQPAFWKGKRRLPSEHLLQL